MRPWPASRRICTLCPAAWRHQPARRLWRKYLSSFQCVKGLSPSQLAYCNRTCQWGIQTASGARPDPHTRARMRRAFPLGQIKLVHPGVKRYKTDRFDPRKLPARQSSAWRIQPHPDRASVGSANQRPSSSRREHNDWNRFGVTDSPTRGATASSSIVNRGGLADVQAASRRATLLSA